MSIFTSTGYSLRYNILHPWEVVINWFRDIKCAWQRANKGYCYRDIWSIDRWFLRIMPQMIDELIEIHHGFPAGMTDEQWVNILKELSLNFRNADDENTSFLNPYEDEYLGSLHYNEETKTIDCSADETLQNNFRRLREEKEKFIHKSFNTGMDSFHKHFFDLWD